MLLRKTIKISLDQFFETARDDFRPIQSVGVNPSSTLVLAVDDVEILEIPDIRKFTLRDPSKFRELDARLRLLEQIFEQVDAYGTAVVIRTPGGSYDVPSMKDLRVTVEHQ